jgi:hypothetical protein
MVKTVLVSTRKTKGRAEKLKNHIEIFGMIKGSIVQKGDIYEIRARPTSLGKIYVGDIDEKRFRSYLRVVQYGSDGEVI